MQPSGPPVKRDIKNKKGANSFEKSILNPESAAHHLGLRAKHNGGPRSASPAGLMAPARRHKPKRLKQILTCVQQAGR